MLNLTEITSRTVTTISVRFTGMGLLKADYTDHMISPYAATLVYRYTPVTGPDGWTGHTWRCDRADLTGWRVLKPGPDGELRVSDKATHGCGWNAYSGDVTDQDPPEAVADLVNQMRPSGEVAAPTVEASI